MIKKLAVTPVLYVRSFFAGLEREFFSSDWYAAKHDLPPALSWWHFRLFGCRHGFLPHPLLLPKLPVAHGKNSLKIFRRFLSSGFKQLGDPHPLFNVRWYLEQNKDVAEVGVSPFLHFLKHGASEGRSPHPLFDPKWYAEQSGIDLRYINPLEHFLLEGYRRVSPHPLFDVRWYSFQAFGMPFEQLIAAQDVNVLLHYIDTGDKVGISPSPLFNTVWYKAKYGQHVRDGDTSLAHYIAQGVRSDAKPHPLFDGSWYSETYDDVRKAGLNPLVHFYRRGALEGRWKNPVEMAAANGQY